MRNYLAGLAAIINRNPRGALTSVKAKITPKLKTKILSLEFQLSKCQVLVVIVTSTTL